MESKTNELVQKSHAHEPTSGGRDNLVESMFDARPAYIKTNLALSPAVITRMMCKASASALENAGNTLIVKGFFLTFGTLPPDPDTGRSETGYTLTLMLADGKTVSSTSRTLIESFGRIVSLVGDGPWNEPVPVTIVANSRRSGAGQWLQCYIDTPEA